MAKKEQKSKVKSAGIYSIRFKIMIVACAAVLMSGLFMLLTVGPTIKSTNREMASAALADLSYSYGQYLNQEITNGVGEMPGTARMQRMFDGCGMRQMKTSYVYITDAKGTMLYHPDTAKIGKPVENAAVKEVVSQLSAGKRVNNTTIVYEYKGAEKYAGVFVPGSSDFIMVVTVDGDELMSAANSAILRGIIALVIIVILFGAIAEIVARRFAKPIVKSAEDIVTLSQLDFTESKNKALLSKQKGEVGMINDALNELRSKLAATMANITGQVATITTAAEELDEASDRTSTAMSQVEIAVGDIATGATAQAEDTQTATENVVVMGNNIVDMSAEVDKLKANANEMAATGKIAQETFDDLQKVNNEAEVNVRKIVEQTARTNKSVADILQAVDIISSIAEETNLLSLNASIEAARAGEQGRGFAVVAGQIQKLAEQSNASASEIDKVVQQLLKESEESVAIMDEVQASIKSQSEYVEKSDKAFDDMLASLNKSVTSMNVIIERAKELGANRDIVVDVVQNLSAIAEENAASTEETNATVNEVTQVVTNIASQAEVLKEIAGNLQSEVAVFKY